jgi:hypothetical protein
MRIMTLGLCALALAGCSRFVWNDEPFTPDPAPASEVIVAGRDTTYVLRSASYYLLASERSVLWQREVMDDVAWRYRELLGEAPPLIAVRVDTAPGPRDSTWRGVPLAVVTRRQPGGERGQHEKPRDERALHDSATTRLLAGPLLAATAAEAWLAARARGAPRDTDGEPAGDAARPDARRLALPAWLETGALGILASPGAAMRAASEVRANSRRLLPLASLVGVHRPSQSGVAPVFIAQSVTVLAFMRERDPAIVARLVDELARGRTVGEVLATSTTLPHDVAALEVEWRKWVERTGRRR